MRVLFLDFDGVLNSVRYFDAPSKRQYRIRKGIAKANDPRGLFDPAAVERLNEVVRRTDSVVVISSSRRLTHSAEQMAEHLYDVGFIGYVLGATPVTFAAPPGHDGDLVLAQERGYEIQAWLDSHGEVESFAIVDDFSDMAHLRRRLVQTDTTYGLQGEHVDQLVKLLLEDQQPKED